MESMAVRSDSQSAESYILLNEDVEGYLKQSFPQDDGHFEKLRQVLATSPLFTTLRTRNRDVDRLMPILEAELSKQCTTLNWDAFEHFMHPAVKDCVIIKNRGPFDLDKPSTEIIVDLPCGMAVLRGANIFKQGIIAAPHSLRKDNRVAVYTDLDGKCLKGMALVYQGKKLHIGNGISQVSRNDLFSTNSTEVKTGIGVLMTEPMYQAPSLSDLDLTDFFPQNLPSVLCGHVLNPQPGEAILDMCAAPGGKTTHIASLMNGQGRVVALEKSRGRATRMQDMIQRMGHTNIEIYTFDSTKAISSEEKTSGGPPFLPAVFDRILLDAPCSALGQRPCLANWISLNQIKSFPVIQRKLLNVAVQLLKPGGVLIYSTCTLPKEENEDQVIHVLNTYPEMELVQTPFLSSSRGLASKQLSEKVRSKVLRFDPAFTEVKLDPWDTDSIGFFIAKFQKKKDGIS